MPLYQTPNGNTLLAAPYNPYNEFNGDPSMSIVPPNSATGGGIYLHMPMPAPAHTFGIYAPPQPLPPGASMSIHPTQTSTAITYAATPNGGLPQQFIPSPSDAIQVQGASNGYYSTPSELTTADLNGTMHVGGDGLQFQCIPYSSTAPPPPMPFYYAAGSAVAAATATAGGMSMNGIATIPQPQCSGSVNGGGCSNTASVAGGPPVPQVCKFFIWNISQYKM